VTSGDAHAKQDAAEAAAALRERGVRFARISHPDLFGRPRSKDVPIERLPACLTGLGYAEASLVEGLDGEPLSGADFPADRGHPDVHAVPALDTARILPWEPETAWLLADLHDAEGNPSGLCSRNVLRRAAAALQAVGYDATVALELEFYLLHAEDGQWLPYSPETGMAYTAGPRADPDGLLRRTHAALLDVGLDATTAHREFSPGQFEINLSHGPAESAVEQAFLLKEVVKVIAQRDGLRASFMPKPFPDHEGSGAHVHISLGRDGVNAMAGDDDAGLSRVGLAFMAGVLEHAPALQAIAAPTINSYKRFTPDGIAPKSATWARDHRFAYVRVPAEGGQSARIEFRGADAAASPYLMTAALLLAGRDGIERDLTAPGPIAQSDPGTTGAALPSSLPDALDALQRDPVLCDGLGRELVTAFVGIKAREARRFAAAVTDWERSEYGYHA
jgi:glutamine synthetase